MKILLPFLLVVLLTACQQKSDRLEKQVAFWKQTIASELPIGSSSDQIEKWASSHKIHFTHRPEDAQFSATVEKFPAEGLRFPCNNWNVVILIKVDKNGRSTKSSVYGVGDCP
jgi:hypothetical protein